MFNITKLKLKMKSSDIVIVQWPLGLRLSLFKGKLITSFSGKKVVLIHDIESLRYNPDDKGRIYDEIKVLNEFDVLIAHNESMKTWLLQNGIKKEVYILQLFDYLITGQIKKSHNFLWQDNRKYRISIAGNLDCKKSEYLYKMSNGKNYDLFAYGINYQENSKIFYKGSFEPEELPTVIEGDFGLVWDGNSIESCEGDTGNYLKYNSPHKFSLYICAAMPVIVWSESAISKFVEENNIGFCVNSLHEIDDILPKITQEKYREYCENVWELSKRVRSGYYTKKVLSEIGIEVSNLYM